MADVLKGAFVGGELDPALGGRVDVAKYGIGCKKLENFIAQPHGGVYRRPGLHYVAKLLGPARLFEFEFNVEQAYVLVFTDELFHVALSGGVLGTSGTVFQAVDLNSPPETMVTEVTPYPDDELREIKYTQSADTMVLCRQGLTPGVQTITRSSLTNWTMASMTFGTSVSAPSAGLGAVFTPSASRTTAYNAYNYQYVVTAVDSNGEESLASVEFPVALGMNGPAPNEWVAGDVATVSWTNIANVDQYNVYKAEHGGTAPGDSLFGYIGTVTSPGGTGTVNFVDNNYSPDLNDTPSFSNNSPYNDLRDGRPWVPAFHQQRLWFGGSQYAPQTVVASRSGAITNFNYSFPPRADDSLSFTLSSQKVNAIRWLESFSGELLIGTSGGEWGMSGSDSDAITPSSVKAEQKSNWGSEEYLQPIQIGNSLVHTQYKSSKIRDLYFSFEQDETVTDLDRL